MLQVTRLEAQCTEPVSLTCDIVLRKLYTEYFTGASYQISFFFIFFYQISINLVIKFVSDLWQVGGFLRVLRFPPPIKTDSHEILLKVALSIIKPNQSINFGHLVSRRLCLISQSQIRTAYGSHISCMIGMKYGNFAHSREATNRSRTSNNAVKSRNQGT
jgi:hypothetical protein